jgi:hypothetical protein
MRSILARFKHPGLERLYRYWHARIDWRRGTMPACRLDPVELGRLLPNVLLVEVSEPRFRARTHARRRPGDNLVFRVAGDEIERRFRRSLRGLSLAEAAVMLLRYQSLTQWSEILADAKPKYRHGPMQFPEEPPCLAEQLLLPLSAGDTRVSHILGGMFYSADLAPPDGLGIELETIEPAA